ncbi:MAG: tRNA (guanosine(37)-N1)-methyltransferase TrmD [Opitutales bacterium]|nr:tRNA (guanosine(37)-N1)-methyltransferase TrmD [Opitutales bacterium]
MTVAAVLTVDVLTLFPGMISGYMAESMLGKAVERGLLSVDVRNLRDWAHNKWNITDDRPFGGGAGMVMKPEPLAAAIDELKQKRSTVIYLTPDGEPLTSPLAKELSQQQHLILVSGHYEGIDQRIRDTRIDREISIGDYILTNGTLPAAVLIDAVARFIPGVLGEEKSLTQDSFQRNLLGFPQYTRPVEFEGRGVPEVLLSGNHAAIEQWREEQRIAKTKQRRPDLIDQPDPET